MAFGCIFNSENLGNDFQGNIYSLQYSSACLAQSRVNPHITTLSSWYVYNINSTFLWNSLPMFSLTSGHYFVILTRRKNQYQNIEVFVSKCDFKLFKLAQKWFNLIYIFVFVHKKRCFLMNHLCKIGQFWRTCSFENSTLTHASDFFF